MERCKLAIEKPVSLCEVVVYPLHPTHAKRSIELKLCQIIGMQLPTVAMTILVSTVDWRLPDSGLSVI